MTQKIDARSIATNYGYNALNRVKTRSYNDGTTPAVSYYYDNLPNAKGKLIKVENAYSKTEYQAFDILGRVTQSQQTTDGTAYNPLTYTYNLSGALIEETYPSGRVVKNTLDNDGDLQQVQSRKANDTFRNYANSFNYTAAGAVASMRLGNGKWETTSFNIRLQPTQIGLGSSATNQGLLKLNYDYGISDNNGNVKSQQITVPNVGNNTGFTAIQTYSYDSLNRLKDAKEMIGTTQTWKQTFTFDRFGNRNFDTANTTTLGSCPANQCNPTVNIANNRFNSGQGYTYDLAGNIISDAQGRTFIYDAENKQKEVRDVNNSVVGQYFYDGDGKRVKKFIYNTQETTIFVYDASGKMVAEYSTTVAPVAEAKVSYLTSDHLGSPRITTDANGQVISRRDFHPFGEELTSAYTPQRNINLHYGQDAVRQKFTAYERDTETDLDFAQARMYANRLGRFTSTDPTLLSVNGFNPQSWNRYVYVLNNPYLYTDPLGLWEIYYEDRYKDKKNKDGTITKVFDRREVFARKTKDGDDGASLAKQLGLNGKDATKFAEKIGGGDGIQLSKQGGDVGRVFNAVEDGLTDQVKFETKNKDKLAALSAKGQDGNTHSDCSRTACQIGLGQFLGLQVGTNILDPLLGTDAKNVAESDAQVGDIIRYAKQDNVATHFANFIFRNDDGTPIAFSKSGEKGRYEVRSAASLQFPNYGTIRGREKDPSGYYRRK